jgi:hypothetical protein
VPWVVVAAMVLMVVVLLQYGLEASDLKEGTERQGEGAAYQTLSTDHGKKGQWREGWAIVLIELEP